MVEDEWFSRYMFTVRAGEGRQARDRQYLVRKELPRLALHMTVKGCSLIGYDNSGSTFQGFAPNEPVFCCLERSLHNSMPQCHIHSGNIDTLSKVPFPMANNQSSPETAKHGVSYRACLVQRIDYIELGVEMTVIPPNRTQAPMGSVQLKPDTAVSE